MKIIVFPGSFDPITTGHVDIVERALPLFDKIIIGVGVNSQKKTLFDLDRRMQWLYEVFKDQEKVEIASFENLTAHFCKKQVLNISCGVCGTPLILTMRKRFRS